MDYGIYTPTMDIKRIKNYLSLTTSTRTYSFNLYSRLSSTGLPDFYIQFVNFPKTFKVVYYNFFNIIMDLLLRNSQMLRNHCLVYGSYTLEVRAPFNASVSLGWKKSRVVFRFGKGSHTNKSLSLGKMSTKLT